MNKTEKAKAIAYNGVIDNIDLLIEDHGCLVLNIGIRLQDGAGYVTFGNTSLAAYNQKFAYCNEHPNDIYNWAGYYISRVFNVLGIKSIKSIQKDLPIRAIMYDGICIGIQNFMDHTNYYVPQEDFANELSEEEKIDLRYVLKKW